MHMRSCMRAYATVQKLLCHETIANLFWVLREHRAGCRLPPALLPARQNQSPDAVRSRNPSKSTLAHDAVAAATAVSQKHHSIIHVGAGLPPMCILLNNHSFLHDVDDPTGARHTVVRNFLVCMLYAVLKTVYCRQVRWRVSGCVAHACRWYVAIQSTGEKRYKLWQQERLEIHNYVWAHAVVRGWKRTKDLYNYCYKKSLLECEMNKCSK